MSPGGAPGGPAVRRAARGGRGAAGWLVARGGCVSGCRRRGVMVSLRLGSCGVMMMMRRRRRENRRRAFRAVWGLLNAAHFFIWAGAAVLSGSAAFRHSAAAWASAGAWGSPGATLPDDLPPFRSRRASERKLCGTACSRPLQNQKHRKPALGAVVPNTLPARPV